MVENFNLFPKAKDVLFCPQPKDTVYCHRGLKKPDAIHIQEVETKEFGHFFLKK